MFMFRYYQTFDFKSNTAVWVLRVLFPEEIDRDTRNCWLFGPWAVRAAAHGDVNMGLYLLLRLLLVVN